MILSLASFSSFTQAAPPNILWITSEDNGQQLGCYGDEYADTPNLDALAKKSLRYKCCWSNAPVCAPARTTIISGMYATSLGGHHMRSGVRLPQSIKLYPQVLRDAGYFCTNNSKKDYNFENDNAGWHESGKKASYTSRATKDTPFFAVFNITISHESKIRSRPHTLVHDPAKAKLPSYHPDTSEVRHDWAQYYDKMTAMDREVGDILSDLEKEGLADSTIVFYYGDHGSGMPRSKRWPFDSGLRVPLLVHVPKALHEHAPEGYSEGGVSDQLVAFVDLAPTAISIAGVQPPDNMQGVPFAGEFAGQPKEFLFGFRGRMDERIDMVRSATDGRFVYMKHFYPDRPYLKHVDYMFQTPTTQVWKQLFDEGKLNGIQAKFWKSKPSEELFDLQSDPDETINLAEQPQHQQRVAKMRSAVKDWMKQSLDMGIFPEAEMHRAVPSESSPRAYALNHQELIRRAVELSFETTNYQSDTTIDQLASTAQAESALLRFWAVRGLALRASRNARAVELLAASLSDQSPSVAAAAADGLLRHGSKAQQQAGEARLLQLANVENVGHFAAVAALNILDDQAEKDETLRQQLKSLPRQLPKPPPRVGKYVGRLLEHVGKQ